jgi:hypothetical protein
MGYVRQKIQILNDKFSLADPPDKLPRTSLQLAQNWRVDRTGKLVSRWGYPRKYSIAAAGYAHTSANCGGDESDYYTACNVTTGFGNPCSVYYNANPTPIVTGLSGYRVGFAAMPIDGMYIMDRAKQGYYDTSTYYTWGIAAPGAGLSAAAGSADPTGPNGSYNFFVTFGSTDLSYETNPSPESPTPPTVLTVTNQDVNFTGVPISTDPRVGFRYIYAVGGTLGSPYLVATIPNNTATTAVWNTSDLAATDIGQIMPTKNGLPPAGCGLVGPYYDALYTWVGNRLYYTRPGLFQYWDTDPAVGDWVDVGQYRESIIWCTCHTGVLMIYKEKSIWQLAGDPYTGTLNQIEEGVGLTNAFAICTGRGNLDYFVSPNGLMECNMNATKEMGPDIRPLFNSYIANGGNLTPPGSILPGPNFATTNTLDCYGISLGYAMGKLYVSYDEQQVGE